MEKVSFRISVSKFLTGRFLNGCFLGILTLALTLAAVAQDTSSDLASVIGLLNLPGNANLKIVQSTESHNLKLDPTGLTSWRISFADRDSAQKKFIFEKNATKESGKSVAEFNLNSDGTIKEAITFFADLTGKQKELRYVTFADVTSKPTNITMCWDFKACIALDKDYCEKIKSAQKKGQLKQFLNEAPTKVLTERLSTQESTMFGSSANKIATPWYDFDPVRPGNFIKPLVASDETQNHISESLNACRDILKACLTANEGVGASRARVKRNRQNVLSCGDRVLRC